MTCAGGVGTSGSEPLRLLGYSLCVFPKVGFCWNMNSCFSSVGRDGVMQKTEESGGGGALRFGEVKYSLGNISMRKKLRNIWIAFSQRVHMD